MTALAAASYASAAPNNPCRPTSECAWRKGAGRLGSAVSTSRRSLVRASQPSTRSCGSPCSVLRACATLSWGLEKLGLLRTDGHGSALATVAGIVACAREPREFVPGAEITAVRYKGVDRASGQVDAQDIAGPINEQITQSLAFVVRNMRVGARKGPARVDLPEYSARAIFEALVNAVVHRDYSMRGSRIRLSVYSDRLELSSPGGLPNNLTVASMTERQVTRNQVLASILGRMSVGEIGSAGGRQYFMERRGDGVSIINRETIELAGKDAQFRLIDDSELCLTVPAAEVNAERATVVVTVRSGGSPLAGADVLALFPSNTWERSRTDDEGEAPLDLHSIHLPMTVFVAREGYAAHVEKGWLPMQRALAVELAPKACGGSVVFAESTGRLPGLAGRLNPILDTSHRTYLYATNIAINGGQRQPVPFVPGEEDLHLMDADGTSLLVRVVSIAGQSSILDYSPALRAAESDIVLCRGEVAVADPLAGSAFANGADVPADVSGPAVAATLPEALCVTPTSPGRECLPH